MTQTDKQTRTKQHANTIIITIGTPTLTRRARRTRPRQDQHHSLRRCLIEGDDDDGGDTNDIGIVGGTDITDIDSSVHEALMRRTNDNSKPAYMRPWRYWCVFNVLLK